jgi:hypothetical protein
MSLGELNASRASANIAASFLVAASGSDVLIAGRRPGVKPKFRQDMAISERKCAKKWLFLR